MTDQRPTFMRQYFLNRAAGFPFCWSVRAAWAWRKGPNTELRAMHRDYMRMKEKPHD